MISRDGGQSWTYDYVLRDDGPNGDLRYLLGYIVLEQFQAAVDMLGLRLIHVKKTDLK